MDFARGLTPHTILVLVDKPEKTIMMSAVFTKMSYKLVAALSLYEALKLVDQEMPHLTERIAHRQIDRRFAEYRALCVCAEFREIVGEAKAVQHPFVLGFEQRIVEILQRRAFQLGLFVQNELERAGQRAFDGGAA